MEPRVKRLEQSILEVVSLAPAPVQAVIQGLQALRGVAHISAVTIAAELGNMFSRFESARKLMGYSGVFPSEDSSGERIRRGGITKAGNAHLRRIVVESAWSYRHRPSIGARLRKRQEGIPAQITELRSSNFGRCDWDASCAAREPFSGWLFTSVCGSRAGQRQGLGDPVPWTTRFRARAASSSS